MTPRDAQQDNLKAFLDGELPLRKRLAMRLHLLRCPACREEFQEMKDISNELRAGDAGALDMGLRARILDSLPDTAPDAVPDTPAALPLPNRRRNIPKLAFGATATAVIGWFVFYPLLFNPKAKMADISARVATATNQASINTTAGASDPLAGVASESPKDSGIEAKRSASSAPPMLYVAPSSPRVADSAGEVSLKKALPEQKPARSRTESSVGAGVGHAKAMPQPKVAADDADGERKVHREGNLTVEVDRAEQKSETIAAMVKTAGGYVASNELHTEEDGTKTASLTTKVPVEQFDSFLAQISKLGDVKAKSVNGEDITEKSSDQQETIHVLDEDIRDLETKVQKARHSRQDADSLRQLRIRQAQEQARMKALRKMATLADITIELREKPKPEAPKPNGGFLQDINETAHSAVSTFAQAARLPVLLLVWAVVYLPLFLALLVLYRVVARFWFRATS